MSGLTYDVTQFIDELDAAIAAHLDWTRRVMRCAVLHTSPGEDVLAAEAHRLCHFGQWFESHRLHFDSIDARKTRAIETAHHAMHDAIREMCVRILDGRAGETAELDAFEHTQSELINAMVWFKTHLMSRALQLDPLTGLPLRYGLDDTFAQLQKKCSRDQTQLYVAMIDIDHFKTINDTHGHATGDAALRHVADTLKSIVRQHEPLYRYGGEEFLLLMQCHSVETAAVAAQRIVNRVRNVPLQLKDGQQLGMTVTLGLAQAKLTGVTALDDALALADNALYAGKRAGRNQYAVLEA